MAAPKRFCVRTIADAETAMQIFARYTKLCSWLYLTALGYPTLRGIIVTEWTTSSARAVEEFANELGVSSLLVRTDRFDESPPYPEGGYLVDISELPARTEGLTDGARVLFLLEPRSPFDDLYSVSVALWPGEPVVIEVVGPGFDAADLKRGRETPHETIRTLRSSKFDRALVLERHVVDNGAYRRSVERRMRRIGDLLLGVENAATNDVATALKQRGETLLLEHLDQYEPIPISLLTRVYNDVLALPGALRTRGIEDEPIAVSMGYLGRKATPTYWDIVWPGAKYSTPS